MRSARLPPAFFWGSSSGDAAMSSTSPWTSASGGNRPATGIVFQRKRGYRNADRAGPEAQAAAGGHRKPPRPVHQTAGPGHLPHAPPAERPVPVGVAAGAAAGVPLPALVRQAAQAAAVLGGPGGAERAPGELAAAP